MKLQLLTGTESLKRLGQQDFQSAWAALHQKCHWATVFQSPVWAGLWYEIYSPVFQPVIVAAQEENGDLAGLLLLAEHRETGELVAAGAHQAEYQTWLAHPLESDAFILGALDLIQTEFAVKKIQLAYLPQNTPLGWLDTHPFWRRHHEKQVVKRPLVDIGDGSSFTASLKKKHHKSHLSHLKRKGTIEFKRLTTVEELAAIFDEIIILANFRLGERYNYDELPLDLYKKAFYLEQMRRGLLHVTTLEVGGQVAAVKIATFNGNEVRSSILTHSPFFTKGSPGRVHLLMVCEQLAKDAIPVFDLTPHGSYKEQSATRFDKVTQLNLCFSTAAWRARKFNQAMRGVVKKGLCAIGRDPKEIEQKAFSWWHKWQRLNLASAPATLLRLARQRLYDDCEVRAYKFDLAQARQLAPSGLMRRDNLADLLQYQPAAAWQPRVSEFLRQASAGFEKGHHCYTYAENGALLHWGWLAENRASSTFAEVGQTLYFPPQAAVLSSFHTQPQAQGRGLYRQALTQILHEAAHTPGVGHLFIFVHADNGPSRHVIEKLGFEYQFSLWQKTRWGRVERWTTAPPELTTPPAQASDKSVELSVKSARNTHVSRHVVELRPTPRRPDRITEAL